MAGNNAQALAAFKRKLEVEEERGKRVKTLLSHVLANLFREPKPVKDGEKPSKKIKGNALHFLLDSDRRTWSHSFSSWFPDVYPTLREEAKTYIQTTANDIYSQVSKVLTPKVVLLMKPEKHILKHNGSEDELPEKQAEVLIDAYRCMGHYVTQARAKEMSLVRGFIKGKSNKRFSRCARISSGPPDTAFGPISRYHQQPKDRCRHSWKSSRYRHCHCQYRWKSLGKRHCHY